MDELDLIATGRAGARRTDPDTSHIAAADIEASGLAQKQREAVRSAVRCWPGCTAAELAHLMRPKDAAWRFVVSRRLPELEGRDIGQIRRCLPSEKRPCRKAGKLSLTWWPITTPDPNRQMGLF